MADLDNVVTDPDNDASELPMEELDAASGGRIKIPLPAAVLAWDAAKVCADNPGFC